MLICNFCLSTCTQLVWEWLSSKIYKEPEKVASQCISLCVTSLLKALAALTPNFSPHFCKTRHNRRVWKEGTSFGHPTCNPAWSFPTLWLVPGDNNPGCLPGDVSAQLQWVSVITDTICSLQDSISNLLSWKAAEEFQQLCCRKEILPTYNEIFFFSLLPFLYFVQI